MPHPFGPDAEARVLAALVNSSDDAIIAKDLDGTVLTWNPGAERMGHLRVLSRARGSLRVLPVPR